MVAILESNGGNMQMRKRERDQQQCWLNIRFFGGGSFDDEFIK
jgi:hypothetical protein